MAESKSEIDENIIYVDQIKEILLGYFKKNQELKLLNVGSKGGIIQEFDWLSKLGKQTQCYDMDYDLSYVKQTEFSFFGDICSCPEIPDDKFDIVYVYNVLEHVKEPWKASEECIRVCKPGGVVIIGTPFAWYYHKHPVDFWRFTHEGLRYLFERDDKTELMIHGFKDISWPTKKARFKATGIQSLYVGKKK